VRCPLVLALALALLVVMVVVLLLLLLAHFVLWCCCLFCRHTSTTICMTPSTKFNFQPVGDGQVGPVYKRILAAWSEEVGVDIAGQAAEYKELLDGGFTL